MSEPDETGWVRKSHLPSFYKEFFKYYVFEPPIDDEATYEIFQKWDTVGAFQFESDGMRNWLKKLKPTNIDDIIAMVSLYRPGPMEWIPNYIDRKQWKEKVTYLSEDLYKELVKKYGKEVGKIITIATCVVIDEANSAVVVLDREKYLVLATPDIDPEEVYDFDFWKNPKLPFFWKYYLRKKYCIS